MAGRNQVTLTFVGDSDQLERAFAKIGIAAKAMSRKVEQSSTDTKRSLSKMDFASPVLDVLGALPAQLKGASIVAGTAIGAVMAPAAASALISGILLGVGGGALAAGIIGAAKSPKVKAAWKKFADQAGRTFERFSAPFIAPMIRAANTFRSALRRAEPIIVAMGRAIAPVIDKLAPALASMAEKALPGILAAVQGAVPLFDALAANAPGIGLAMSQFFQAIAAGGPAATAFFSGFLGWVQEILPKLGGFVTWLANLGTKMGEFSKGPEFTGLKASLIDLKDNVLAGVKKGFDDIGAAISSNSGTWKTMNKDIQEALRLLGPVLKDGINNTLTGIAAVIIAFAKLYEAVRKVAIIVKELFGGSSRLPGNLGNVQFGNLPKYHSGGVVPGAPGTEQLAVLQAGEKVTPAGQSGGSTTLAVTSEGASDVERLLVTVINRLVRNGQLKLVRA